MTDKQPITEDEKILTYSDTMGMDNTPLYWVRFYKNHSTLEDAHKHGDKIRQILDGLKALEELPKLKEHIKLLEYELDYPSELQQENQKLKAEIRQLKFRIADEQDSHTHVECKTTIDKLKAENEELKKPPFRNFEKYNCEVCQRECLWVNIGSRPDNLCMEHRKLLQQENNQLKELKKRVEEQTNECGKLTLDYVKGRTEWCGWKGLMKIGDAVTNSTEQSDYHYIEKFELLCEILGINPDEKLQSILKGDKS